MVRIPAEMAKSLGLKEGDDMTISAAAEREFELSRHRDRKRALQTLRRLRQPVPPGFRFDQDEANAN